MLEVIKADLYRYFPEPFSIKTLFKGFRAQGFRYMFFRRLRDHYGRGSFVGWLSALF